MTVKDECILGLRRNLQPLVSKDRGTRHLPLPPERDSEGVGSGVSFYEQTKVTTRKGDLKKRGGKGDGFRPGGAGQSLGSLNSTVFLMMYPSKTGLWAPSLDTNSFLSFPFGQTPHGHQTNTQKVYGQVN